LQARAVIGAVDITRAAFPIGADTYEPLSPMDAAPGLYILFVLLFDIQRSAELRISALAAVASLILGARPATLLTSRLRGPCTSLPSLSMRCVPLLLAAAWRNTDRTDRGGAHLRPKPDSYIH
jgi:hypothetical protein